MLFNFRKRARRSNPRHKLHGDRFEPSFPLIGDGIFGGYVGDFSAGKWYEFVVSWHCYDLPVHGRRIGRRLDVDNDDGESWSTRFASITLFAHGEVIWGGISSRRWASLRSTNRYVFRQESVFFTDNPMYENLLGWSGRRMFFYPSGTVISLAFCLTLGEKYQSRFLTCHGDIMIYF